MHKFKPALLAIALAATAAPAFAETVSDTFDVTITIDATCAIATNPVAFGVQEAEPGNIDEDAALTVNCTNGTAYQVGLSGGNGGDTSARVMTLDGGTDTIGYQLYKDAARTDVWGNVVGSDTVLDTGDGFGADTGILHTVYARATITGAEVAGDYSDTVTATVTF